MAAIVVEYRAVFTDAEGERTTNVAYAPANDEDPANLITDGLDAWCTSLATLTQATLTECTATIRAYHSLVKPASGPAGSYDDIEDKAFLEFQSSEDGALYKISVPAPKSTVFLSDEETVDPAQVDVAAFITLVTASLIAKYGSQALTYIKGYRKRAKTRRTLRAGISSEIGG